jgi:hypothetical protein
MARKTENREKREMYTVGPGIWRENRKMRKTLNSHDRTGNTGRNTEIHGK